jgi:hypothetical protein
MLDRYRSTHGFVGILLFRCALRILQFVFAIVVAALYGVDLGHATTLQAHAEPSWIYAEVVACLSVLTCSIDCFVTVKWVAWTAWDWLLCTLWAAQSGVFASIYLAASPKHREEYSSTTSVTRMKVGVWINLVNVVLWLVTAVMGIARCCCLPRATRRTDRFDLSLEWESDVDVGGKSVEQNSNDIDDGDTLSVDHPPPYRYAEDLKDVTAGSPGIIPSKGLVALQS